MRRVGGIVMILVMAALLTTVGCGTTGGTTQADLNAAAQAVGALSVGAYNVEGSKFTPQQRQAAKAAIGALAVIGKTGGAETGAMVQEQVNKALAEQIKDPQQLALAQSAAATFIGVLTPYMEQAMAKYGSSGAVQVFMAFCKGVGSVPIN